MGGAVKLALAEKTITMPNARSAEATMVIAVLHADGLLPNNLIPQKGRSNFYCTYIYYRSFVDASASAAKSTATSQKRTTTRDSGHPHPAANESDRGRRRDRHL